MKKYTVLSLPDTIVDSFDGTTHIPIEEVMTKGVLAIREHVEELYTDLVAMWDAQVDDLMEVEGV